MKVLWWEIKKKRHPQANHEFNDEDRAISEEIRKLKYEAAREKQRLELDLLRLHSQRERLVLQEEIEDLQEALKGGDSREDSSESLMLTLLLSILGKGGLTQPSPPQLLPSVNSLTPPVTNPEGINEDALRQMWESLPRKIKKTARQMSDDDLRTVIISKMPNIDANSVKKAIEIIRE